MLKHLSKRGLLKYIHKYIHKNTYWNTTNTSSKYRCVNRGIGVITMLFLFKPGFNTSIKNIKIVLHFQK